MSDTMSLLFASGILAIGGLGLFMFKNDNDKEEEDSDRTTENNSKGINLFSWNLEDNNEDNDKVNDIENLDYENDDYIYNMDEIDIKKPRRRSKTHRNRRISSTSRRRY